MKTSTHFPFFGLLSLFVACAPTPTAEQNASVTYDIRKKSYDCSLHKGDLHVSIQKAKNWVTTTYKLDKKFEYRETEHINDNYSMFDDWHLCFYADSPQIHSVSVHRNSKNSILQFEHLKSETDWRLSTLFLEHLKSKTAWESSIQFTLYGKERITNIKERFDFLEKIARKELKNNKDKDLAGCYALSKTGETTKIDSDFFSVSKFYTDELRDELSANYAKVDSLLAIYPAILLIDTTGYQQEVDYEPFFHWRDTISPVSF